MKKSVSALAAALVMAGLSVNVFATNGDNLIGVGPTSRSMGGTGIAAPQDAISAIFSNPAALSQITGSQFNFAGTYFAPTVKATVVSPASPAGVGNWKATSQDAAYAVPAIGLSTPMNDKMNFGIAAYGVSGMGVDYRNKDPKYTNTKVSVMKFVPAVSYKYGALSYGAGLDIDYQAADFGAGLSHNYAIGARLGAGYEYQKWNFGLTYVTPQNVDHKRIYDFDGSGGPTMTFDNSFEDLKLENPAQYGAGVAYKGLDKWVLSADIKYLDWANADGYSDFGWRSQTVYGVGLQNKTTDKLTLRAGWNYGKNPLKLHNGFNAGGLTPVQGSNMSTFGYEYFRVIGFPGIVEHHVTLGAGYEFSPKFTLNLGYKKALAKTVSETDSSGTITLKSKLSEDAYDMGLTFKF
ncbi:MAG TPA: aromatic hydrocarbon degradation protein [Elusimicrobia bacterium]|nr:aromatic hydrocarbon degradation protein [Elusimicrobiota bacterium]